MGERSKQMMMMTVRGVALCVLLVVVVVVGAAGRAAAGADSAAVYSSWSSDPESFNEEPGSPVPAGGVGMRGMMLSLHSELGRLWRPAAADDGLLGDARFDTYEALHDDPEFFNDPRTHNNARRLLNPSLSTRLASLNKPSPPFLSPLIHIISQRLLHIRAFYWNYHLGQCSKPY